MESKIYSQTGKEVGTKQLPESVFGVAWNPDMVHEVVVSMQSNARANTANTKDRSEVSGGGKKPWRQKGTGRARHGSKRSPIWVGGGVAHGPTNERNYKKKINKKVKSKALASVLSKKYADSELILLDALNLNEPKTKEIKSMISSLAQVTDLKDLVSKRSNTALVVLAKRDEVVEKSFRNLSNFMVMAVKDINPLDLLTFKYVILVEPETGCEVLVSRTSINKKPQQVIATN